MGGIVSVVGGGNSGCGSGSGTSSHHSTQSHATTHFAHPGCELGPDPS
jgi:hypothetical protein